MFSRQDPIVGIHSMHTIADFLSAISRRTGSFFSTVAGHIVWGGGGGGQLVRAKPSRVQGEKPRKVLKFSFLKSLQMYPILKTS